MGLRQRACCCSSIHYRYPSSSRDPALFHFAKQLLAFYDNQLTHNVYIKL